MTSECNKYQKKIAQSFLGDVTAQEQQALKEHLTTCSNCRSEQESYAQTLNLLKGAADEPVPRHFFVYPEERVSTPWQLFRGMRPAWQAVTAAAAAILLVTGLAAFSSLQIRSNPNERVVSFGRGSNIDVVALKKDILQAAEQRTREMQAGWTDELRAEMARSHRELTQQQQAELNAAITRLGSRFSGRITTVEGRLRDDTQRTIVDLYQTIAEQRAQDLNAINTRLDSTEANDAVKARQTNAILDTLLQVADLRLR